MKIEKALEKSKLRRQQVEQLADGTTGSLKARSVPFKKDGWVAPLYSDSARLEVDQDAIRKNRCVCFLSNTIELDYYKVLRTQLVQSTRPKGWNTIMITSARPGEGKTLTSINLALTFARAYNQTVLLVDCDLRQQKVYRYLGLKSDKGMVDYLLDGRPLRDLIIWPQVEKMTLISGGRTTSESAELLGSQRMRELVAEMKERYAERYVLFDAPPILSGADTLALAPLVDGILMVVESGKTSIKEVEEAVNLIPKEKFLGFVLNKHTSRNMGYYSYYAASGEGKKE